MAREPAPPRVLAVLGMHRSGTSALAGSLELAGVHLGDTFAPAFDNPKGNRESTRVLALHDDLLHRGGARWDRPEGNLPWEPIHRALRDAIIDCNREASIWGFKDPRTLFVLGGWLRALPRLEPVGIFRHPLLVAESLRRRNDFPLERGLELWLTYNRVLRWHHERLHGFPLVEFDIDPVRFTARLDGLRDALRLKKPAESFFEPSLRQQTVPDAPKSASLKPALALYGKLQRLALD